MQVRPWAHVLGLFLNPGKPLCVAVPRQHLRELVFVQGVKLFNAHDTDIGTPLLFYGRLSWLPGPGRLDVFYEGLIEGGTGVLLIDSALAGEWEIFRNALAHLVLPAAILGYFSLAYISRMTRSFMLEQLSREYIVTARVKGMSERRVVWGHALGNVWVPLVTVMTVV